MLRGVYDRVLRLAGSRWAVPWLAGISFAESSFFPVPPDVMLAPMVLARPERGYFLALVCTIGSVLGGIAGYGIGYFLAPLGLKLLALMGHAGGLATFQAWYAQYGVEVILVKGLTPIPFKLVTIASGLARFNFWMFVGASIVTRGARFMLVAAAMKHGVSVGETMARWLRPILEHWALAAACAAAAMLAIAHGFERFGGLLPCTLCLYQRDVYWAALIVGVAGFALSYTRVPWIERAAAGLLAVVFLTGTAIAAYHAGVEWKWWPGPTTCSGAGAASAADLSAFLGGAKIKPPHCDEAAWRMLGLSMAGWNALISLALVGLSLMAARLKPEPSDDAPALPV